MLGMQEQMWFDEPTRLLYRLISQGKWWELYIAEQGSMQWDIVANGDGDPRRRGRDVDALNFMAPTDLLGCKRMVELGACIRTMMTCNHQNTTTGSPRCFSSPVAIHPYTDENPSAHGNIVITEECRDCSATRSVAVNGQHTEKSPWIYATE